MNEALDGRRIALTRSRLLDWFDDSGRDLPWRRSRDPYHVWVSEIMLQQTRVDTVVPYYHRWLASFPDITALADADPDEVMRAWEGLGYYVRAGRLREAAIVVRDRYAGRLPGNPAALSELPGIGAYTAGAIASIAFGEPVPAVDGNVRRVLARLTDTATPSAADLDVLAGQLVPTDRPGDFNQALMDLGATICTHRAPRCTECPLAEPCRARERGTETMRPTPRDRRKTPTFLVGTAILAAGDRTLIVRRPRSGLLAGLWEFPGSVGAPDADPRSLALGAAAGALTADPRPTSSPTELPPLRHAFTHRTHIYHAFVIPVGPRLAHETPDPDGWTEAAWVTWPDLSAYALPRAQRRIARRANRRLHVDREAKL